MTQKIVSIIVLFCLIGISFGQDTILTGNFEFNKIMNGPFESDSLERNGYSRTMDNLNVNLMDKYISALFNSKTEEDFQVAENLLSKDPYLSTIPTRAISMFYTMYWAYQHDLLFNPSIVLNEEGYHEEGKIIYMTLEQLEKIKPILNKKLSLVVKFVASAKATKIDLYQLIEIK